MGKSYKKNPVTKDSGKGKKWAKNQAARRVRNRSKQELVNNDYENVEISSVKGNEYKKQYERWNIADYVCRWTREEAIAEYDSIVNNPVERYPGQKEDFIKRYPSLEKWLNWWEKCMLRK